MPSIDGAFHGSSSAQPARLFDLMNHFGRWAPKLTQPNRVDTVTGVRLRCSRPSRIAGSAVDRARRARSAGSRSSPACTAASVRWVTTSRRRGRRSRAGRRRSRARWRTRPRPRPRAPGRPATRCRRRCPRGGSTAAGPAGEAHEHVAAAHHLVEHARRDRGRRNDGWV